MKRTLMQTLLITAVCLSACTPAKSEQTTAEIETTETVQPTTETIRVSEVPETTTAAAPETTDAEQSTESAAGSDEEQLLPPSVEQWFSDPVYSTTASGYPQIIFHDAITESQAIFRRGQGSVEEISDIYYHFDESKEEQWTARLENGTLIPIRVQVTVDISDIHGILASWEYEDYTYTLWEDNARQDPAAVAKMAMELIHSNLD